MTNSNNGHNLLDKYIEGSATHEERLIVEAWYATSLLRRVKEAETEAETEAAAYERIKTEMWTQIAPTRPKIKPIRKTRFAIAAAATLALTLGISVYLSYQHFGKPAQTTTASTIVPGSTGATLTLANGEQIDLTTAGDSELSDQAGLSIRQSEDGLLVYEVQAKGGSDKKTINTLSTARGESFIMVLPDKSKVWLNADSRLTFDANMKADTVRRVTLQGEAYFEVAKVGKPFIVRANHQEIKVLGTTFNIHAYPGDQHSKTTLVEGRVQVHNKGGAVVLKPGEMAIGSTQKIQKQPVDIAEEIAWKEGNFVFSSEKLSEILKTIGRWYDLDFVFLDHELKAETFEAMVPRATAIEDILLVLESTGKVKFEIKNRTAYVKKKTN